MPAPLLPSAVYYSAVSDLQLFADTLPSFSGPINERYSMCHALRQKTEAEHEPRPFPQDFLGPGYSVGLQLSGVSRSQRFDSYAAGGGRPFLCGVPGKGREHHLTRCEPATVASSSLSCCAIFHPAHKFQSRPHLCHRAHLHIDQPRIESNTAHQILIHV